MCRAPVAQPLKATYQVDQRNSQRQLPPLAILQKGSCAFLLHTSCIVYGAMNPKQLSYVFFWQILPWEGKPSSFHCKTSSRMQKSQCAVHSVYSNGLSICLSGCGKVVMTDGCSSLPLCLPLMLMCLYLFLLFCCVVPFPISVLVCTLRCVSLMQMDAFGKAITQFLFCSMWKFVSASVSWLLTHSLVVL